MKIIKTSEALPKSGRYVLAWLQGAKIPMRAMWAAQHTLPLGDDEDPEWGEYSEEKDEYFCPAGWYEMNQHEEQHWGVDGNVVAWCELPRLDHQCLAQIEEPAQPVCWIRFCSDGSTEGPIMHSQICEARKTSGAWTPLYAGAAPAAVSPRGEYPQLPEAAVWSAAGEDGMPTLGKGWMFSPVQQGNATLPLFTAQQMWAYHDLGRQSAPAAPALEAPAAPATSAQVQALHRARRALHAIGKTYDDSELRTRALEADEEIDRMLAAAPQTPAQEAPAAPAVPAGFALVPIEPTQQMLDAGRWSGAGSVSIQEEWARKEMWSRMLATITPPPAAYTDDLVALVENLAQALSAAAPDNDLAGHALNYLKRNGLQESPLRAAEAAPKAPAAPAEAELMQALSDLVNALRERHYGRMPEEVQAAYDKAWAIVFAGPAPAAAPAAPAVDASDPALPSWWPDFIQCVAELPDRNSPEDEPDAMIATAEELGSCALAAQAKEGGA